jgi:hypothetical protein
MDDQPFWGDASVEFTAPQAVEVDCAANGPIFSAAFPESSFRFDPTVGTLSVTHVISLRVPVNLPAGQELTGYWQVLQFGLGRTPGVRALIVADLAGTLRTLEYDYDTPPADPNAPMDEATEPMAFLRVFSAQGMELLGDGHGIVGAVPDYVATVLIKLERRSLREHGSIHLDGLDVTPCLLPTAAPKGS